MKRGGLKISHCLPVKRYWNLPTEGPGALTMCDDDTGREERGREREET